MALRSLQSKAHRQQRLQPFLIQGSWSSVIGFGFCNEFCRRNCYDECCGCATDGSYDNCSPWCYSKKYLSAPQRYLETGKPYHQTEKSISEPRTRNPEALNGRNQSPEPRNSKIPKPQSAGVSPGRGTPAACAVFNWHIAGSYWACSAGLQALELRLLAMLRVFFKRVESVS